MGTHAAIKKWDLRHVPLAALHSGYISQPVVRKGPLSDAGTHVVIALEISKATLRRHRRFLEQLLDVVRHGEPDARAEGDG